MADINRTPWTDEQVKKLEEYQKEGHFHPYTCGNDSRHRELVPTTDGWICQDCDYKQDWALLPQ